MVVERGVSPKRRCHIPGSWILSTLERAHHLKLTTVVLRIIFLLVHASTKTLVRHVLVDILLAHVGLDIALAKRLEIEGEVAVAEELSISIPRIHGDSVRSPFFGGSAEVVLQTPRGVRLPSALTVNHREVWKLPHILLEK